MIDDTILDCTKNNREQSKNRFFCKGPKAIMMFEQLLMPWRIQKGRRMR
jgi:hypothetical protein